MTEMKHNRNKNVIKNCRRLKNGALKFEEFFLKTICGMDKKISPV